MIRRTIVALVSVLALALTASAPAQAATVYSTNVTLDAKPEPIAKNKTVTLKGTLKYKKDGQWRALPTTKVLTVVFDPAGPDKPRKIGLVRTTRTGAYTYKATASRSGKWTVRYAGKAGTFRADSGADAVCVYSAGRWQCPVSPTNPDLDCKDIGKTVWVGTKDYHALDADNDGWGCDSYS